jgi:hypothetical protein
MSLTIGPPTETGGLVTSSTAKRSQAWFRPGRYVPVSYVHGLEVLAEARGGVRLGDGTLHGTAAELRGLAAQMLRAADVIDSHPQAA